MLTDGALLEGTTLALKHSNLKKVYGYLYDVGVASKLAISRDTGLSIPTVASNVEELASRGLVSYGDKQQSTGGRRAQVFACNGMARIAIGVELLKEELNIVAIDLYGNILSEASGQMPFKNDDTYFAALGAWVNGFIDALPYGKELILGVSFALQGLISPDGKNIVYSELLKCTGTTLQQFQHYLSYPCALVHDTEAAALAESWKDEDSKNAVYLALNRNFGGTVIMDGQGSATIEHMCLDKNGETCYCGKKGCVEVFCSADHLKKQAGMAIPDFFHSVREGNAEATQIWHTYLQDLARTIDNLRMVVNCGFIIGGYLSAFMQDEDFDVLRDDVEALNFFPEQPFTMKRGRYGEKAPELGAAISLVDGFLKTI